MNTHVREQDRLASLDRYDILDTPPEEAFDRITRLTTRIFGVPIATVALVDGHRQWFKSRQGLAACELPRAPALCDIAIRGATPLIVPNTLDDERFADSAFVVGEPHIRFYAGVPLRTPEGENIGTVCAMDTKPRAFGPEQVEILSDLARIVMTDLNLRKLATVDGLTGALSRRAFRDEAGRALALARRHGQPLSCILVDLDHFKAVNDGHGHAVGDQVLAETVATCRGKLRTSDPIGRIGGEEFAIVLPQTSPASAMKVAEKLRAAVARQRVAAPSGPLGVTASFGVAGLDRSVADLDALLARADEALYAAKADGRNRCEAWQPAEAPPAPDVRRRVLKAGRITFNGGHASIDCTVRTLSDTAAGLDVISSAGIPDQFKLQIEADGLSRLSRIVGKRDRHLEVAFA